MIILIGGLFNNEQYFDNLSQVLKKKHNIPVHIYLLNHDVYCFHSQSKLLANFINYQANKCHKHITDTIYLLAFSMGCSITLNSIQYIHYPLHKLNIFFINPSNIFNELCLDTSHLFDTLSNNELSSNTSLLYDDNTTPYKIKSPKIAYNLKLLYHTLFFVYYITSTLPCIRNVCVYLYYYYVGRKLEEPYQLLKDISVKNPIHIITFLYQNAFKVCWTKLVTHLPTNIKKIKIISGNKDRYNTFAQVLSTRFNNHFTLCEINGSHHIPFFNYNNIVHHIN